MLGQVRRVQMTLKLKVKVIRIQLSHSSGYMGVCVCSDIVNICENYVEWFLSELTLNMARILSSKMLTI